MKNSAFPLHSLDQPDLKTIEDFYQHDNGNFWIALNGEEVIGTIALVDISNRQVALRKMFVAKPFRGNGIGVAQALLDAAIAWCRQKQVRDILLGTTSVYLAAHRFYEKNEFIQIDKAQLPKEFPVMSVDSKFYRRAL